jgi:hypothetical protein
MHDHVLFSTCSYISLYAAAASHIISDVLKYMTMLLIIPTVSTQSRPREREISTMEKKSRDLGRRFITSILSLWLSLVVVNEFVP